MPMDADSIRERLQESLAAEQVWVNDLTGGGDHWEVAVTSSKFLGLSRIQRQRLVMSIFDRELKTGEVHALTIKALAPGES